MLLANEALIPSMEKSHDKNKLWKYAFSVSYPPIFMIALANPYFCTEYNYNYRMSECKFGGLMSFNLTSLE